jgi:hypothetical protein
MGAPVLDANDKASFQSIIGLYQQYFTQAQTDQFSPLIVVILYDQRSLTDDEIALLAQLQTLVNQIWEQYFSTDKELNDGN